MPIQPTDLMWCSVPGCAGRPVCRHLTPEVYEKWKAAKNAEDNEFQAEGATLCSLHLMDVLEEDPKARLAPIELPRLRIDPTEVITPDDVETELRNLLNRQEDGIKFLRAHRERFSQAEGDFLLTKAAALATSGQRNAQLRDAEALLAAKDHFLLMRAEKVIIETAQDSLKGIHYDIDVWRSLGASVRSSYENAGRGQPG